MNIVCVLYFSSEKTKRPAVLHMNKPRLLTMRIQSRYQCTIILLGLMMQTHKETTLVHPRHEKGRHQVRGGFHKVL